jgi:hypothetical protein
LVDPWNDPLQTIPFYATDIHGSNDYNGSNLNANIRNITIPENADTVWQYYGCFLDVFNDNQSKFGGTHHCIVAEIAYDDAPIPPTLPSGAVVNSQWDQLAQRNLQITTSNDPASQATLIVPQAFVLKPSSVAASTTSIIPSFPDELMIDWGNTPTGSTAQIYWPQLQSADVIALANQFYASHFLYSADANTVQVTTTDGVTYIPIPSASAGVINFAGLITVTLPSTVTNGQTFYVTVRRVSSVALTLPTQVVIPPPPQIQVVKGKSRARVLTRPFAREGILTSSKFQKSLAEAVDLNK